MQLVTRVWDVFIAEGSWKIAYRVSLAILKLFEAELLSVDLEGIMTRLRPDNVSRQLADAVALDELWEVAFRFPLRSAAIQQLHDQHVAEDLTAIADLGVKVVRYGTPWRLAEPEPGVYDWSGWDRAFAACENAGLESIVALLHFGLPDHCGGFVEHT